MLTLRNDLLKTKRVINHYFLNIFIVLVFMFFCALFKLEDSFRGLNNEQMQTNKWNTWWYLSLKASVILSTWTVYVNVLRSEINGMRTHPSLNPRMVKW